MSHQAVKRFYREARVAERDGAYVVSLDGKPAKTSQGMALAVPGRALAEAIAEEWQSQGERLDPGTMPITTLAIVALDRVPADRGRVIEHILGYGRTDLVCYRAELPAELEARQKEAWDPLLAWITRAHGITLAADSGISYIEQPAQALIAMQKLVSVLDDFALASLNAAATRTGSFVIALALIKGRLNAEQAFAAAQVDELYQAEKWGRDADAETRRKRILGELKAIERFALLLAG